jgi:hypothetical protein
MERAKARHPATPTYYHALGAIEEELFELKWCILHRPGSIIAGQQFVSRRSIREEFMSIAVIAIRAMEECQWSLGDKGKFPEG